MDLISLEGSCQHSSMLYVEECLFRLWLPKKRIFAKPACKVQTQVETQSHQLYHHSRLIDTEDSLNIIISKPVLWMKWPSRVKHQNESKLRSAVEKPMILMGSILTFLELCQLHVTVWFGFFENLSVLLKTPFIYRYIWEIFPGERHIVPKHLKPVSIIRQHPKLGEPFLFTHGCIEIY